MRFRLKGRRLFAMRIGIPLTALMASLFLSLSVAAQDLGALIGELDAKPYAETYALRTEIEKLFAEATAPSANTSTFEDLEQSLLDRLPEVTKPISRQWLIRVLEWFGSEASVPLLAAYLKDSDKETSECARRALIANPSAEAIKVLAGAFIHSEESAKGMYLDAFVYRNDVRSVKVIKDFLQSGHSPLVEEAARALIQLGGAEAIDSISQAYSRADAENRAVLERAILASGADAEQCWSLVQSGTDSGIATAAFRALVELDAEAANELLHLLLAEPASLLRSKILRIAFEEESLQPLLVSKLKSIPAPDQLLLLDAISDCLLSRYEEAVIALLASPDKEVQRKAVGTLGYIGGQASFQPLYDSFLKDSNEDLERALSMLNVPQLNNRLFDVLDQADDPERLVFAVRLLGLRNADGAEERFRSMIEEEGSSRTLRKACMKALESLGTLQTCQALADFILQEDPLKRDAQRSLKRLCLNYGDPDVLWNKVFRPALESASSDQVRQDLLAIADSVAGDTLMIYISELLEDPSSDLRPAAIKVLSRWPNMDAGELWIKMATVSGASASDIKAAQSGLSRIVKNNKIEGWEKLKLDMIVDALEQAPTDAFKKAMVASYYEPSPYIQHYLHDAFEAYVNDPQIGLDVQKVLAMVPDSKERRKR